MMRDATVRTRSGKFQQDVEIENHRLIADEPESSGGENAGPAPHDFLLAALGACTSMTVKMYADRKGWPLRSVEVKLTQAKENDVHVMRRDVKLEGDLDAEQRARLLEIANKCPVHKTLSGEIRIESKLSDGGAS
jgi:putative redox protein